METINNMFDERNPDNLIQSRKNCIECCGCTWATIGIIILVAGILVALQYIGTYLLFGFIIAGSPNHNRTTGCPNGVDTCTFGKMLCYQEDMFFCHILGIITLMLIIIGLIIAIVLCYLFFALLYYACYGIYVGIDMIAQSFVTASNMSKNSENNYDITSSNLPENNESQIVVETNVNVELPNPENIEPQIAVETSVDTNVKLPNDANIPLDDY